MSACVILFRDTTTNRVDFVRDVLADDAELQDYISGFLLGARAAREDLLMDEMEAETGSVGL